VATDNFNRANESPAAGWTSDGVLGGPLEVYNNAITKDPVSFDFNPKAAYYAASTVTESEATYAGGADGRVWICMDGSGNGYFVQAAASYVYRSDAGTATFLAGNFSFYGAAGDVRNLRRDGSDVVAKLNGTEAVRTADTTYTTGHPGLGFTDPFRSNFFEDWTDNASGGGQSIDVNLASETDTAFAIGKIKYKALGLTSETSSAFSIGVRKSRALGLTTETDSAFAAAHSKQKALGLAAETDSALPFTAGQYIALGLVSETDSAFSFTPRKAKGLGLVTETDSALAMTWRKAKAIGLAATTDTALALRAVRSYAVGLVSETSSAFSFIWRKAKALGLALESDIAFALEGAGGGVEPGDPIPRAFIPWRFARHLDRLKYADQGALEAAAHAEALSNRVWAKYAFYYFGKRLKIRVREVPSYLLP
jgi:hypothetical protein